MLLLSFFFLNNSFLQEGCLSRLSSLTDKLKVLDADGSSIIIKAMGSEMSCPCDKHRLEEEKEKNPVDEYRSIRFTKKDLMQG